MAPKQMFFDWKVGQFACVRHTSDQDVPLRWHFAEIARIIPARTHAETMAEVYLYSVPEVYPVEEGAELLGDLYPSFVLSREVLMLSRIAAGIKPRLENRYSQTARVPLADLCRAEPRYFLAALTEGRDFSLKRIQSSW
jgi:hypothetical protein